MQNMMSMYGNMWMEALNPMDMDQEMLAAYRYAGPNWDMNRYLCTTCGRTYSLQASLYNHKKFECGKNPNFICPYCPHRTKQKGNLKTHIKKRHPEFFSEPFMPSPSRLNSMMNSIMLQSSMMQQTIQSSQNAPNTTQASNMSMQNASMQNLPSPMMQNAIQHSPRSVMQNSPGSYMQSNKSPNNVNNLLQAMKHQKLSQNTSSQSTMSAANFVQALAQSLPNSTNISALDILQVLAQGSGSSSSVNSQRMSSIRASSTNHNPPPSPQTNKVLSVNESFSSSRTNQLSSEKPTVNGASRSELPKSPIEKTVSVTPDNPKDSGVSNFTTTLSLEAAESDDSSDTSILPSYPVSE